MSPRLGLLIILYLRIIQALHIGAGILATNLSWLKGQLMVKSSDNHIGTNNLIRTINLSADFMLMEDGNEIMISYDIAEFFSGIDLSNPDNFVNMTFTDPVQAGKIARQCGGGITVNEWSSNVIQ